MKNGTSFASALQTRVKGKLVGIFQLKNENCQINRNAVAKVLQIFATNI